MRRLDVPYMRLVIIKGMSRVLFKMIASFMYRPFATKRLEKIWAIPRITKNIKDTFLMLMRVSIKSDYTQKCLKWETNVVNLGHENFRRRS